MKFPAVVHRNLFLALTSLAVLPALARGQEASDLMRRAVAAQAERLAGVDNVTIVQDMMGMEMTMYMEKKDAGGVPVLIPVSVSMGGMTNLIPPEMAQADLANPFQEEWVDRTRFVGTEELGGRTVKVFVIDDFSGLQLPGLPGGAEGVQDFRPKSLQYSLDEDELLVRSIRMEGDALQADGSRSAIKLSTFLEDYREVDGYMHPFVTRAITEGVVEAAGIDQEEVKAQLEQLRAQLANMPEAQRAMMEGMLKVQMDQLEGMMGEGGTMEITITVKDLKVNAGR